MEKVVERMKTATAAEILIHTLWVVGTLCAFVSCVISVYVISDKFIPYADVQSVKRLLTFSEYKFHYHSLSTELQILKEWMEYEIIGKERKSTEERNG